MGANHTTSAAIVAAAALSCSLSSAPRTAHAADAPVTYADIAPLVFDRCVRCHHPDGPAPFSLASYADVRRRAALIAAATSQRLMPPWKAESSAAFVGMPALTDAEIARLGQWVKDGALEGDRSRVPTPTWHEGWQLGTPDLVIDLPQPYTLPSSGADVWRVFVLPVPLRAMRYVRGLEFRPGNPRVVHHARIRLDRTRASRDLDARDPAPGYEGVILRSALYPDGHFLGWTPGQAGPMLPPELAWRLDPESDLVIEVHMVPTGKPEAVQPSVGLFFSNEPPRRTPAMLRLGRKNLDIAPGEAEYVSADSFVVPVDVQIEALQAHAHARARRVRSVATLPDGQTRLLLSIADWDVRWQHLYQFAAPLALPKGSRIDTQFTFDNSARNPRNPVQPPRRVLWGEEATSEMGELWVQMLTATEPARQALNAAIEPKMVAEDAVGYESRLRADPSKAPLHDEAGEAYLRLGRPAEAIPHFQASVALQPGAAAAHNNLGIALNDARRVDEAVAEFEAALRLRPDYALAHNNLGTALIRLSRPAAAIEHFRRAAALEPDWPLAVSNLAWLLATAPDEAARNPVKAIELAQHAALLTGRLDAGVLDVLAAAHAARREFDRALAIADEALALEPADRVAAAIRARRALYQQRTPYISR